MGFPDDNYWGSKYVGVKISIKMHCINGVIVKWLKVLLRTEQHNSVKTNVKYETLLCVSYVITTGCLMFLVGQIETAILYTTKDLLFVINFLSAVTLLPFETWHMVFLSKICSLKQDCISLT